jgi:broad specificity phosphatase PhoE
MSTVILIRPGSTDFDEQHRIQGTLDLPLNAKGEEQVRQTIEDLSSLPLGMVYTSPCEPARSTAARLGTQRGVPVKDVAGLENWNHGLWQGLPLDELRRKQPKVFRQWLEAPASICPPGGESLSDVWERVRKALVKPLKSKVNVAIVASEPLATIIGCLVRGTKLAEADFGGGAEGKPAWEYLRTNGHGPAKSPEPVATKPIRNEVASTAP